jgi:hypothetical protein
MMILFPSHEPSAVVADAVVVAAVVVLLLPVVPQLRALRLGELLVAHLPQQLRAVPVVPVVELLPPEAEAAVVVAAAVEVEAVPVVVAAAVAPW